MTTKQTPLPEQAPSIISYSSDGMDDENMMESFALEDEPNNEYLSDTLPSSTSGDDRDEVKEIRKLSTQETRKVRCWRVLVFFMLVCTAVAVTLTSYFLLTREEDNKFETAFYQFARTVGDSALAHQRDVRASFASLASALTVGAEVANATWPFYYLPKFESFAEDTKKLSRAEYLGVNNVVHNSLRESYIEDFSNHNYQAYIQESHMAAYGNLDLLDTDESKYHPYVSRKTPEGFSPDIEREYYYVRTTTSPPPRAYGPITNWNVATVGGNDKVIAAMISLYNETVITQIKPFQALPKEEHEGFHTDSAANHPHSFVYHPIYRHTIIPNSHVKPDIVAILNGAIAWDASMRRLLPDNVEGIFCVIRNTCNQVHSYEIYGEDALYRGSGDLHESKFDHLVFSVDLDVSTHPNFTTTENHCRYRFDIYPTVHFESDYKTQTPLIFALVIAATFAVTLVVFFTYDVAVYNRNEKLVINAAKSSAIVSSLFPGIIRERLMEQHDPEAEKQNLKSFMTQTQKKKERTTSGADQKPLADLFLDTTIMFADIVGFTAWSSVREPSQVFTLLETVFSAFDEIAKRRRVFKVETVGDCYVAVAGLPEARQDHAVVMARYAVECMEKMHQTTKDLEFSLGPDTTELALRIGIHSGPVTAGVLRGERARFQLFGDTMNTAARIEGSGKTGRIHVSAETAALLIGAGKENWLEMREDKVEAKGKGDLQTYWLAIGGRGKHRNMSLLGSSPTLETGTDSSATADATQPRKFSLQTEHRGPDDDQAKNNRLIGWNTDILLRLLREIVARRNASTRKNTSQSGVGSEFSDPRDDEPKPTSSMPLDEVKEIIRLPDFDSKAAQADPEKVVLPNDVVAQLRQYVTCVAQMYQNNAFHNFDHASHVVMSVVKLMSRIVAPTLPVLDEQPGDHTSSKVKIELRGSSQFKKTVKEAKLHDHTYGITSDPLTQFACVFAALIHDVDHSGVPNTRLCEENPQLAAVYQNRSVAEQNSFDLSWSLLMDEQFSALRAALCATKLDLMRFRQLAINAVMATDLADKELKTLRNNRWDKAFQNNKQDLSEAGAALSEASGQTLTTLSSSREDLSGAETADQVHRKATIVIEHLIQASDVAHTMQHWHVYRKWNERLFEEMYLAFKAGRSSTNPADFWYEGELGFFDFYIIPLANKLGGCGVFGISSDEYLTYATSNRDEWKDRGQQVLAEMVELLAMKEQQLQQRKVQKQVEC